MRLRIVRHGESEGNVAGTLQGCRIDAPLSSRGRRQAEALSIRLSGDGIDLVVASPLSRAKETAEILAAPHGLGVRVDPELVEFDWGTWTGRPLDDALEAEVKKLRARWRAGHVEEPAPGGESPVQAASRASRVLERLSAPRVLAPLVVAHGRFNRILLAVVLGRDLARMDEIRQRNASLSVLDRDENGTFQPSSPELLDDLSHLPEDLRAELGRSESLTAP